MADLNDSSPPSDGTPRLSGKSVVVATQSQISGDLADEVVILSLDDGIYYSLNAVGARIWRMLGEPRSIDEIRRMIVSEYEVEPELCKRDILRLVKDLARRGLVKVE